MRNVVMIVTAIVLALVIVYIYERQSHRNVSPNQHGTAGTQSVRPAKKPINPPGK